MQIFNDVSPRPVRVCAGAIFAALLLAVAALPAQARVSLASIDAKLTDVQSGVEIVVEALDPPAGRRVTLAAVDASDPACVVTPHVKFHEANLDGTLDSSPFVVPLGHRLVIGDVSWQAAARGTAFRLDTGVFLNLVTVSVIGAGQAQTNYLSEPVVVTPDNENASIGGSENLAVGVELGAGRFLCGAVNFGRASGITGSEVVRRAIVRGVLVPDGS